MCTVQLTKLSHQPAVLFQMSDNIPVCCAVSNSQIFSATTHIPFCWIWMKKTGWLVVGEVKVVSSSFVVAWIIKYFKYLCQYGYIKVKNYLYMEAELVKKNKLLFYFLFLTTDKKLFIFYTFIVQSYCLFRLKHKFYILV